MNALLNYTTVSGLRAPSVAGLRTDVPMDSSVVSNYMQMPILPIGGGMSDTTAQVFNNVPMFGGLYGANPYATAVQPYGNMSAYGRNFSSSCNEASYEPSSSEVLGALSGKALEKAKKSSNGDFAVRSEHTQMASQLVDQVKEVLTKNPSEVSDEEVEALEKTMNDMQKNPMIAEAFLTEANETTFRSANGKTSSFFASYEQLLTKKFGREEGTKKIEDIQDGFKETLVKRNPDALKEAGADYKAEKDNVEYSFGDRLKAKAAKHPFAVGTLGLTGAAGVTYGAFKAAKLVGAKNMFRLGKFGLLAGGAAALAGSAYSLIAD